MKNYIFFELWLQSVSAVFRSDGILIYCKACSENVTSSDYLINIASMKRVAVRNETFAYERGVIIQEFINPGGYHFELITVTEARVKKM